MTVPMHRITDVSHNDRRRFAEMELEPTAVSSSCIREVTSRNLRFEPRYRVTSASGRLVDELWVSGHLTMTVVNDQMCWADAALESYQLRGSYKWANAPVPTTTTIDPPCWATTTTTVVGPTTTTTWANAGDVPGLCSEPFDPPIEPVQPLGTSNVTVVK